VLNHEELIEDTFNDSSTNSDGEVIPANSSDAKGTDEKHSLEEKTQEQLDDYEKIIEEYRQEYHDDIVELDAEVEDIEW